MEEMEELSWRRWMARPLAEALALGLVNSWWIHDVKEYFNLLV